jgi:hypothetical protein
VRGHIRAAVVTVALVASAVTAGTAAAQTSSGLPSGKPLPTASDQVSTKPGDPKLTDEQLRKQKQAAVGRHHRGLDDAQLADLARQLGVSKTRLIRALTAAKRAMIEKGSDPSRPPPAAIVRTFARDLGISRVQARKVLEVVVASPDKVAAEKPIG